MNPLFQASILYLSTYAIVLLVTKIFKHFHQCVHFIVLGGQLFIKTLAEFLLLELSKSHFTYRNNHHPVVLE